MAESEKQANPTMLRSNDRPHILTFIHEVDLPRWRAMDAEEKKAWTAFNLRYMARHLDRLAAQLPKEG